ncbi:MAG: exodeoxyribonuclease VII large subunit [Megasphaera micronuciformis]|nr:exodeoxyribonuclease VII large subunit [Megasphaera micronuciformis]
MNYDSVSTVVGRIKEDLEHDFRLKNVAMEGNIIGLKRASTGHWYMNIHDDKASIRAVLFRNRTGTMMSTVKEGDRVVVTGEVNVYEKGGTFSFIIERLFSQGVGNLQQQYEKNKAELYAQGYFDKDHRKELPRFPWKVGVLTSATGAVLHDIQKIRAERNEYIEVVLYPVPVQGDGAVPKLVKALEEAGKNRDLDVLILARGGGSMEDLWCFNDPAVVRAVYNTQVPIITAVGHETDTTLVDYAADVRAATPTHAAELAFPSFTDIQLQIAALTETAGRLTDDCIERRFSQWERTTTRIRLHQYNEFVTVKKDNLNRLVESARQKTEYLLLQKQHALDKIKSRAEGMNPTAFLRKGYGQLLQDGEVIAGISAVNRKKPLEVQLVDGIIVAEVKEVIERGEKNG